MEGKVATAFVWATAMFYSQYFFYIHVKEEPAWVKVIMEVEHIPGLVQIVQQW